VKGEILVLEFEPIPAHKKTASIQMQLYILLVIFVYGAVIFTKFVKAFN
jgi:flagellar biogenesis protein FliO